MSSSRDEVHRTLDVMKTGFATFPKSAARAGRSEGMVGMRVPLSCVRLNRIGKKGGVIDSWADCVWGNLKGRKRLVGVGCGMGEWKD